MKRIILSFSLLALLASCDLLKDSTIPSDSVGGDTNLTMNAVGTKVSTNVQVGTTQYPASATVTSNNNGVITVDLKATLPKNNSLVNLIPASLKDANGNLSTTGKYKNTSESMPECVDNAHGDYIIINIIYDKIQTINKVLHQFVASGSSLACPLH